MPFFAQFPFIVSLHVADFIKLDVGNESDFGRRDVFFRDDFGKLCWIPLACLRFR